MTTTAPTAAVITAAGAGTRLGADRPKALVPLAGYALVTHAVAGALRAGITEVVVTAPASHLDAFRAATTLAAIRACCGSDYGGPEVATSVTVVVGGASRQASVAAGLQALTHLPADAVVLVHDGARCLTPPGVYQRVIAALAAGWDGVIPGLPVSDTLKVVAEPSMVGPADAEPVHGTVDRASMRAIQTPQGFQLGTLRRAHARYAELGQDETLAATDDAGLVEKLGGRIGVVEGDMRALKITTPLDLRVAELLLTENL